MYTARLQEAGVDGEARHKLIFIASNCVLKPSEAMSAAKPISDDAPNTTSTTLASHQHASGETSQAALDPQTAPETNGKTAAGDSNQLTGLPLASGAVKEGGEQQAREGTRADEPGLLPDKLELPATAPKGASTGTASFSGEHYSVLHPWFRRPLTL